MRTTLKELSIKSRKEHIIRKINNFLRDKSIDEINAFMSLFFFSACERLVVDVDDKETDDDNAEEDKRQIEQYRAKYDEDHHHLDNVRRDRENEYSARN
jgi:hypothetical protein